MVLILATPPAPPPQPRSPWGTLRLEWVGWDGSVWSLNDYRAGLQLLRDGVEGLHFPKITKWSSTSRAVPGQRRRGWQADPRRVFWPLLVWGDGTDAWLERQDEFFRTIHPDRPGTWRVTAGAQTRTLQLTGDFTDAHAYARDPLMKGWAVYPVAMEADQPYWEGQPVAAGPWSAHAGEPFFPGPPFHIGSSATLTSAEITNPGDVDAWPVWSAWDELTSLTLGVSGRTIVVPFDLSDGDRLVIGTDPRKPFATRNGVDVLAELGLQAYAPVPALGTAPLAISAGGTGSVACTITPQHFRAF